MTVYISPPFGTYFQPAGTIPIYGSFTRDPRPGRLHQALRTIRPVSGGWVNKVGLRNPGVDMAPYPSFGFLSLAAVNQNDWSLLVRAMEEKCWYVNRLELNLWCPNVDERPLPDCTTLTRFCSLPSATIMAKLPPISGMDWMIADRCVEAGIRKLHFSNTLTSERGGLSGEPLRTVNLPIVERAAARYPECEITAGGGIYTIEHWRQYHDAGAKHASLSTVFFNPLRGYRLAKQIKDERCR